MMYYAHCMRYYHTDKEKKRLRYLRRDGFVFNPATDGDPRRWDVRGMHYFDDIVKKYRITSLYAEPVELSDGSYAWPSGVYWEMCRCLQLSIPIVYAASAQRCTYPLRILTRDETRKFICNGDV